MASSGRCLSRNARCSAGPGGRVAGGGGGRVVFFRRVGVLFVVLNVFDADFVEASTAQAGPVGYTESGEHGIGSAQHF